MSTELVETVDQRLTADDVDAEVGLLVLYALESDEALDDYLAGGMSRRPQRDESTGAEVEAGGTFLSSIAVEGFRGIGPATELALSPRPGLTIVAGRNGSGKSSLSEALELVLTGGTYRWESRTADWRHDWRNLHHDQARITIGVVEEDSGPITIRTTWDDDAEKVEQRATTVQRAGEKQQDGTDVLGWSGPLEQFRPILSYEELGGLLESGRAKLYDALASILGVEQLTDAIARLNARLKQHKAPGDRGAAARKELKAAAEALDDARAGQAATLLRKTDLNVAALRALATGSVQADQGPVQALRLLSGLPAPATSEQVTSVATRLRAAVTDLADVGAEVSDRSLARLELLEQGLRLHAEHGDMTCPVCRTGELNDAWLSTSRDLAAEQRSELSSLDSARQTLRLALSEARKLLTPQPTGLQQTPLPELGTTMEQARAAWTAWVDVPSGSDATAATALADHLETRLDDLLAALGDVREAASTRLSALEDAWQPLASRVAGWCDEWEAWQQSRPVADQLAAAEKWLKANDLDIKNERLEPIRDQAHHAWSKLRQESNVELGNLSLTGTKTSRKVVMGTSIDGVPAEGIPVLSQGELHALALCLFLPRATMAESPFRFLVLDDPVQAMDPAKVDGLVELLSELAQTRQVIVLSHDDRLSAAVRRNSVDATILDVTRGKDSRVSIEVSTDPATRYLEDAHGLVTEFDNERVSDSAMRRTLPGLLRFAVEAAAKDRFFADQILAGSPLVEVEDIWQGATTTRLKVMLAVFGEDRENHELEKWASAPYRKFGLKSVGSAMHHGLPAGRDPRDEIRNVEKMVNDLTKGAS